MFVHLFAEKQAVSTFIPWDPGMTLMACGQCPVHMQDGEPSDNCTPHRHHAER